MVAGLAAMAITTGLVQGAAPALAADAKPRPLPTTAAATPPMPPVRVADPGSTLGKAWKTSGDRAVTGAADNSGFKILVADAAKAYIWKTVAVLAEPGMSADSWIGNTCVMDRNHAAAVYAPRTFTNKPDLMQGGAFAAVVDLTTGQVTKLPFTATLAYFDPSCNTATHQAAFTAFRDMNDPAKMQTRLVTVDTAGRPAADTALVGEVTSAVPVRGGTVAARGRSLVRIDHSGRLKTLAATDSVPFEISPMASGQVAFVDRKGDSTARAEIWRGRKEPSLIATGRLGDLGLHPGDKGRVFLTGHPTGTPNATSTGITRVNAPADADISTLGRLAIGQVVTPGVRRGLARVKDAGQELRQERSRLTGSEARDADAGHHRVGSADDGHLDGYRHREKDHADG